jgi:hypothetical protein
MYEYTYTGFWWETLKVRNHWGHIAIGVRIIRERILNKCDGRAWLELVWLRI